MRWRSWRRSTWRTPKRRKCMTSTAATSATPLRLLNMWMKFTALLQKDRGNYLGLGPRSSYLVQSCVSDLTWRTHPMQVHYKFELLGEILFLTVNIIDRYLARENVARKKLLLLLLQVYGTCRDNTNSIYFFVLCFDWCAFITNSWGWFVFLMAISLGRYKLFSVVWYILIGGILCANLSWKWHIHSYAVLCYFSFLCVKWSKCADQMIS